jgi:thiol-disulfide isomerase/thioredoxin
MRILAVLLCSVSLLGAAGAQSNRRAPGFALMDHTLTKFYDIQDYRGKVVVIDFMLTACPHCQKAAEILEDVAFRYRDRVVVLEIALPPDNQSTVAKYRAEKKSKVPLLLDCGQVGVSYLRPSPGQNVNMPHLYLINGDGWIVNDFEYSPSTKEIFEGRGLYAELDKMLAAGAPKPPAQGKKK